MSTKPAATRRAILAAARQLLHEQGGGAVPMAQVAQRAGVSRQAVYLHFGSRWGLMLSLLAQETASLEEEEVERTAAGRSAAAALDTLVSLSAEQAARLHPLAEALEPLRRQRPQAAEAWGGWLEGRRAACRRLVERMSEEGVLAPGWDPQEAADLLWAATSVGMWRALVAEGEWPPERWVKVLRRALRRSLLAEGDLQP